MKTERETQEAMFFEKQNIKIRLLLAVLLLAAVGAAQCIGIAYGRYNSTSSESIQFVLRKPPQIYLFSGRTEDGTGQGASRNWSPGEDGKQTLPLCISNSDQSGGNTAHCDLAVRIRIFVPEAIESDEISDPSGNLNFTLQTKDGAVYEAVSAYLSTRTPLYKSIETKGWVYSFVSPDSQNEIIWTLPGGVVSDLSVTLIKEDNVSLPDNFRLYVDRVGTVRQTDALSIP